jgi:peroxiredoxin
MKNLKMLLIISFILLSGCLNAVPTESEIAAEFSLANLEGANVNLSDYKNKSMVLVVFWATWCPSCREEIPELNKLADEHKEKLQILAIDIKEDSKKVAEFAKKKEIKYTILLDTNGETAKNYKVVGIPTNVLIDKDGKILYSGYELEDCKKLLK